MNSVAIKTTTASLVEINTGEEESVDFFESVAYKILLFCRENGIGSEPLHTGRSFFKAYFTLSEYYILSGWLRENGYRVL